MPSSMLSAKHNLCDMGRASAVQELPLFKLRATDLDIAVTITCNADGWLQYHKDRESRDATAGARPRS